MLRPNMSVLGSPHVVASTDPRMAAWYPYSVCLCWDPNQKGANASALAADPAHSHRMTAGDANVASLKVEDTKRR